MRCDSEGNPVTEVFTADKRRITAFTYIEAILKIAAAQRDGVVLAGQVGKIRFNSADPLAQNDIVDLASEAMAELSHIQVAFDILEKKVKPLHVKESLAEDVFNIRENMWHAVKDPTRFIT
jgi:hypothetical protein